MPRRGFRPPSNKKRTPPAASQALSCGAAAVSFTHRRASDKRWRMDKLLDVLRPALPSELVIAAALVLLLLLAWPPVREIWQVSIPSHRAYASEKRRLELLKLKLEVEALKK